MAGPVSLTGTPASPGHAEGLLFVMDDQPGRYVAKSSPDEEQRALAAAVETAMATLNRLAASSGGAAADMLEFQLAMLSDDALIEPAQAAIRRGETAARAWTDAMDAEIAGYEAATDDYFRARAADLKDIRQQVLEALAPTSGLQQRPAGCILAGDDITPSRFLSIDWSGGGGIALSGGSPASHVAMLARARGVPMVTGIGMKLRLPDRHALLDGERGSLTLDPDEAAVTAFRRSRVSLLRRRREADAALDRPALTSDGIPVQLLVNTSGVADLNDINPEFVDGIGLMRSEFLFGDGLPGEAAQYEAYRDVLEWASGRPVTIRTVDAGGDKPVAGYTVAETDPFLGTRGIRLSLARPEVFRLQIRALLRAAVHGDLRVMFPMVTVPDEFERAAALFAAEAAALAAENIPHRMPALGIMVEVPSVAIAPELFSGAAFFSIGSNDLTQYVMAAARDNPSVARLNRATHPAVLRLVENVARHCDKTGTPLSLCGDAGGDPQAIPLLLRAGLRSLSVAPSQVGLAKAAIAGTALS